MTRLFGIAFSVHHLSEINQITNLLINFTPNEKVITLALALAICSIANADPTLKMLSFGCPQGPGIGEPGIYTLHIPMDALLVGGNPTGVATDLYLGVDNPITVGTEALPAVEVKDNTLFSIDGVRHPDNVNPERGIYVRNGKKIIIN